MTKSLPQHPSLEQFRKQAKELLRAFQRTDVDSISRIRAHHPTYPNATDEKIAAASFTLRDAQLVVAREYFFENWADLKEYKTGGATPNAVKDFELAE